MRDVLGYTFYSTFHKHIVTPWQAPSVQKLEMWRHCYKGNPAQLRICSQTDMSFSFCWAHAPGPISFVGTFLLISYLDSVNAMSLNACLLLGITPVTAGLQAVHGIMFETLLWLIVTLSRHESSSLIIRGDLSSPCPFMGAWWLVSWHGFTCISTDI